MKIEFDKLLKYKYLMVILTLNAFLLGGCVVAVKYVMPEMDYLWVINLGTDIFGMAISVILLSSLSRDMRNSRSNRALIRLVAIVAFNLFWDILCWSFDEEPGAAFIVKLSNTMFYMNGSIMAYCFLSYVENALSLTKNKAFRFVKNTSIGLSLAGIILIIVNWFTGFYFTVDSNAVYHRSEWFEFCFLLPTVILAMIFVIIFRQKIPVREKLVFLSYIILPVIGSVVQSFFYGLSITYPAIVLAVLIIYNNIYVARSRKIVEQEAIMTKQSTALMISQIQPHFLYNTLTTISNLCTTNPQEAEECTIMFSRYLRTNLDSLRHMEPVPFPAELDHVEIYLELEKKRFKDKLNVEFDIGDTNFLVPALGIQPIVENSVKHGICNKEEPGHLKISCRAVDKGHLLVIEDDGVGFDPSAPAKNDGRSHVGMQNVKERLRRMVNAAMEVESSPGNGCKTTIFFPEQ